MKSGFLINTAVVLGAAVMIVFGFWAFLAPRSFIDFVNYHPYNEHLTHDLGAFQLGIGATMAAALIWHDRLVVALAGFTVGSGMHTLSHYLDRHAGGHSHDLPSLGVLTGLAVVALVLRWRQLQRVRTERTEHS